MRRREPVGERLFTRSPAEWAELGEDGPLGVELAAASPAWAASVLALTGTLNPDEVDRLERIAAGIVTDAEISRRGALETLNDYRDPLWWLHETT